MRSKWEVSEKWVRSEWEVSEKWERVRGKWLEWKKSKKVGGVEI